MITNYTLRLKELPPTEQPRERLRDLGPQALSDAELLAVLLNLQERSSSALSSKLHDTTARERLGLWRYRAQAF